MREGRDCVLDPNQGKEWLLLQRENMSAVGEWLSCLWSWPQGLQANLPQGAKSLVTSLKSELVLESFRSLPSSAWKLDLRGESLPSALDSPTPHFLLSECSPK